MDEEYNLREMVSRQISQRGIGDFRVISVMNTVRRDLFIPLERRSEAFGDHPVPIGYGQTISQPYIIALMTASLSLTGAEKVLEVGTGCGYQTAILSKLAAMVHTVEIRDQLHRTARENLPPVEYGNIRFHLGDGFDGVPEEAPFDRIIVTAAAPAVPAPLVNQLANGGKMVIPVDDARGGGQTLVLIEKRGNEFMTTPICPVRFVPMIGRARKEGKSSCNRRTQR